MTKKYFGIVASIALILGLSITPGEAFLENITGRIHKGLKSATNAAACNTATCLDYSTTMSHKCLKLSEGTHQTKNPNCRRSFCLNACGIETCKDPEVYKTCTTVCNKNEIINCTKAHTKMQKKGGGKQVVQQEEEVTQEPQEETPVVQHKKPQSKKQHVVSHQEEEETPVVHTKKQKQKAQPKKQQSTKQPSASARCAAGYKKCIDNGIDAAKCKKSQALCMKRGK